MNYTAAVITVSDKGSKGLRVDTSGPKICEIIKNAGYEVKYTSIVPDEQENIKAELIKCSDELNIALVLTTGGTGFSPRDVTPEATLAVVERETRGIPYLMCNESMKITPRGCLSRAAAGIRRKTLIINLPGSEKAAKENLEAVLSSIGHGLDMLYSSGSADCGEEHHHHHHEHEEEGKSAPSIDVWLKEAKALPNAGEIGMYLTHRGVVRGTAKAKVREGAENTAPVIGMNFSYDAEKVNAIIADAEKLQGIYHVRVWINSGTLHVGDDLMQVLIGGDIRPRVVDALQYTVSRIKSECVTEEEITE